MLYYIGLLIRLHFEMNLKMIFEVFTINTYKILISIYYYIDAS